jgi:hypothetical protein
VRLYGREHPKASSEDRALAAVVNANVPEHEKRKAGKNNVIGWKKVEAQLRAQHEKVSAQSTDGVGAIRLVATDARS